MQARELEPGRLGLTRAVDQGPALHRPAVVELPDQGAPAKLARAVMLERRAHRVALVQLRKVGPGLELARLRVVQEDVAAKSAIAFERLVVPASDGVKRVDEWPLAQHFAPGAQRWRRREAILRREARLRVAVVDPVTAAVPHVPVVL